jgi:nucleoside phosphorylase
MVDVVIFAALGWERRAVSSGLVALEPAGLVSWRARLPDGGSCLVVQTGVGMERARTAAATAPEAGLFLSAGCAGALVPWLGVGDLVTAAEVLDGSGGAPVPAIGESVVAWAAARGFRVHLGRVRSSASVLTSAREKEEAAAGGALVVEMESHGVAAEARRRGIPFLGVRVVLDTAAQALPALDILDAASGEVRPGRAVAALGLRPWLWPAVGRLARQTARAERELRAFMGAFLADVPGAVSAPRRAASAATS